ncbi:MAG TPA: helix-turn-helix domain-containing protein [Elusimicrobiota bacterium]|nr:helix-turn-helix domain-containing protein [Elusimicrobiota bacterium]
MKRLSLQRQDGGERMVWREILRSKESRYDHRLHGILFVSRGMSCYDAAAVWGKSPRTVEYWVRRYRKEGFAGLWEHPRSGRPSSLNPAQRALLGRELEAGPRAAGLQRGRWTGALLRRHLAKSYGVAMGVRQCQRLLRKGRRSD